MLIIISIIKCKFDEFINYLKYIINLFLFKFKIVYKIYDIKKFIRFYIINNKFINEIIINKYYISGNVEIFVFKKIYRKEF